MLAVMLAKARWLGAGLAMLVLAAVLGAIVAVVAVGFIEGSAWMFAHGVGSADAPVAYVLLLPAIAGILSGVLCSRVRHKVPPGPADVVRARTSPTGRRDLNLHDGLLGALASFTCLSLGGSVGAYGPLVHMGSTLAAHLERWFTKLDFQAGLGCGAAAAIAAAFNAPLAGVVFAHEVILRQYSLRMFVPVASAALMANLVSRQLLGHTTFLEAELVRMGELSLTESALFATVGLAAGFLASGIIHGCLGLARWHQRFRLPPWVFPALGGLAAGAIALAIDAPEILGGGKPLIEAIAGGQVGSPGSFVILLVAKFAATLLCIGLGMAGGLFSPALVIGALFGGSLGLLFANLLPATALAPVYVYALVGMFATAAPVIGAPLGGILIAVEFSNSYPLAVSVALAIVVSTLVASRLAGGSYYQRQLVVAGVPLEAGPEQLVLREIKVRNRMQSAPLDPGKLAELVGARTLKPDDSLWDALEVASGILGERLAVVDDAGAVIGVVVLEEVMLEGIRLNQRFRAEEGAL